MIKDIFGFKNISYDPESIEITENKIKVTFSYQAMIAEDWFFERVTLSKFVEPIFSYLYELTGEAQVASMDSNKWRHLVHGEKFIAKGLKYSTPNDNAIVKFTYNNEKISLVGITYIPDLEYYILHPEEREKINTLGRLYKEEMIKSGWTFEPKPKSFIKKIGKITATDIAELKSTPDIMYDTMLVIYNKGEYKIIVDAINLINKDLKPYEYEARFVIMQAGCYMNMNMYNEAFESYNSLYGNDIKGSKELEDRVLFYAGLALHLNNKSKLSNMAFQKLIKEQPSSNFSKKARFFMGINYSKLGIKRFAQSNLVQIKVQKKLLS